MGWEIWYIPSMADFSCCDMTPYGQVTSSSETSLCLYLSSHCYIPADIHLCNYCHENLTPHKPLFVHDEEEAMLFAALLSWSEDDSDVVLVVVVVMVVVVVVVVAAAAVVVVVAAEVVVEVAVV
jgi:hypothetical protein